MSIPLETLVSVIIPVYNGERYLGEALESAFAQTYQTFEVIVIDDGSTDHSAEIAHGYGDRIQYYFQENGGIGAARNCGVSLSRGAYLAFLDADDLWVPDKLTRQVQALNAAPELDIVFGLVKQFRSTELAVSSVQNTSTSQLMPGHVPTAMLVRRTAFLRVGDFSTSVKMGEFAEWFLRAKEAGLLFSTLPDLVAYRRLHEGNNGTRQREHLDDYLHIFRESIERRRGAAKSRSNE